MGIKFMIKDVFSYGNTIEEFDDKDLNRIMEQYDREKKGNFHKIDIYDMMYPTMYRLISSLRKQKREDNNADINVFNNSNQIYTEIDKICPENIFKAILKSEEGFEYLWSNLNLENDTPLKSNRKGFIKNLSIKLDNKKKKKKKKKKK